MRNSLYILVFSLVFLAGGSVAYAQKGGGNSGKPANAVNRCQLFVPNAFTPNGDDINERFTVKFNEECQMVAFEMKIFDRWGRLVFETDDPDPSFAWDGTIDGKELKEGVYMWKLYARLADPVRSYENQIVNNQGTVVLIR